MACIPCGPVRRSRGAGLRCPRGTGLWSIHRDEWWRVVVLDPAFTGNPAAVVIAMERQTGIRWVLDVWTSPTKPDDIFDKIKELTVKYKINEWRIKKNAMNLMITPK